VRGVGIGCGGGVLLLGLDGEGFIGAGGRGQGRPEARRCGGPGRVQRPRRARRSRGHAGGLLSRQRRAVGQLWRGQGGRRRAGRGETARGSWARSSPSLHFSRLGSGQRAPGLTAEVSRSMATGFERVRTVSSQ
jgi:hypothetical protein